MLRIRKILGLLLALSLCLSGCAHKGDPVSRKRKDEIARSAKAFSRYTYGFGRVPAWDGKKRWAALNGNGPMLLEGYFSGERPDIRMSDLDGSGRSGPVLARIGKGTTFPAHKGDPVDPSGWQDIHYRQGLAEKSVYHRVSILPGSGQHPDARVCVTGTEMLGETMARIDKKIRAYVKKTGNHVLFRATPIFMDQDRVCRGVAVEIRSQEDGGRGLSHHLFCYNEQPGLVIDHRDGACYKKGEDHFLETSRKRLHSNEAARFVIDEKRRVYHTESCPEGDRIPDGSRSVARTKPAALEAQGYRPADCCHP